MKKFKLKQWYPSLPKWMEIGAVARYIKMYECYFITNYTIQVSEVENNPDFWELIEEEKPLFVTEDGLEVFGRNVIVWIVKNNTLEKIKIHSIHLNEYDFGRKVFYHESNADEYIWRNKPVFSYNDIEKFQSGGEGTWWNVKAIAKERIEE
ncbi:MAG TPA: hypothetical protein GX707_10075 [Epulopiscium sp.]|nr:hypothetical protein [Candidatus Epulonipiscium sp.]